MGVENTISEVRARIEGSKRNRRGRRVYTAALRRAVVELCQQWASSGGSRPELSRRLGLSHSTMLHWEGVMRGAGEKQPRAMRRVEVMDGLPARSEVRVVSPSGICVEGLTVVEAIEVLKALP